MRTSLSFSILIWAYSKRAKNNQASLYARITINGKRVNISLKFQWQTVNHHHQIGQPSVPYQFNDLFALLHGGPHGYGTDHVLARS